MPSIFNHICLTLDEFNYVKADINVVMITVAEVSQNAPNHDHVIWSRNSKDNPFDTGSVMEQLNNSSGTFMIPVVWYRDTNKNSAFGYGFAALDAFVSKRKEAEAKKQNTLYNRFRKHLPWNKEKVQKTPKDPKESKDTEANKKDSGVTTTEKREGKLSKLRSKLPWNKKKVKESEQTETKKSTEGNEQENKSE